ncbi:hypothetical protein EV421DRAFT_1912390 [Armillaria borealis]|uniref:Uncharacterized protein n=1 Tax=Armillaria borealis TaxID=47425 RepID=A0AA39IUY3_9AGAR|nr:hypothetical protein EV421DRAFT_1912390 [Armillaria borealis]
MTYSSAFNLLTVPKENIATENQRGLETFQLGVWNVSLLKRAPLNFGKQFLAFKEAFGYFKRLAIDVYTLKPMLATFFILNELWSGVQTALLLYLSSQILRIIETGLIQGSPETGAILKAVAVRIFFVVFTAILHWKGEFKRTCSSNTEDAHNDSSRAIFYAGSTKDRPSYFASKVRATSNDAWTSFEGIG